MLLSRSLRCSLVVLHSQRSVVKAMGRPKTVVVEILIAKRSTVLFGCRWGSSVPRRETISHEEAKDADASKSRMQEREGDQPRWQREVLEAF